MTTKPTDTPPVPSDEERFEAWYNRRREAEEAEAKRKTPPKDWPELADRIRDIVREENSSFLERIFGEPEGEGGDDTSSGRPPAEGGPSSGTNILRLLGLGKAAGDE